MVAKNRKQFEVKLGKTGVSLLVLGLAAGLFTTFLFGVTVGKNIDTYPALVSDFLPGLIGERLGWKKAPPAAVAQAKQGTAPSVEDEFDLTFYDTLSKKKEGDIILQRPGASEPAAPAAPAAGLAVPPAPPVKAPASPVARPPAPAGQAPPSAGAKPPAATQARNLTPPVPAAQKALQPSAATVPGAAKPAPASPAEKPVAEKDRFLVQLASYQEKAKAEQLNKKVAALGYRPRVEAVEVPGKGTWYRVVLGGYDGVESAKQASAAVSAKVPGVSGVVRREK